MSSVVSDEAPTHATAPEADAPSAADRGIPSINRARSLQSRLNNLLAIGLMSAMGLGFLTWYYASALHRTQNSQQAALAASKARAQGEMPLPPFGKVAQPLPAPSAPAAQLLGPPPPLPESTTSPEASGLQYTAAAAPRAVSAPAARPVNRRLDGPVFVKQSQDQGPPTSAEPTRVEITPSADPNRAVSPWGGESHPASDGASAGALSTLLHPTPTSAVRAEVLPTRRFLLAKGTFIDCTLETAIDSSLPGLATCITATDTFGVDGTVVLLERGTKLVGETRGEVQQGGSRLFVLWTEARTPTGVVVPLASPGTDALGRSGLDGEVNRHFWNRFSAAMLLTLINGAVEAGVQASSRGGGTVILNPGASQDVMTEVLRSTVAIPPTVTKAQGDRIQVLVARDLDFRPVYDLRRVTANTAGEHP